MYLSYYHIKNNIKINIIFFGNIFELLYNKFDDKYISKSIGHINLKHMLKVILFKMLIIRYLS